MAECRTCGTRIEWAITAAGKPMPVEAAADGNLVLWQEGTKLRAMVYVEGVHHPDLTRAVSHFARCPQADQHRLPR